MEKEKIDFNNITSLNYSNTSQNNQSNNDISNNEILDNDKILLFKDDEFEMIQRDPKRSNRHEFGKIFNQMKQNLKSLSQKSEQIINNKTFSLKKIIDNTFNKKALIKDEKKLINKSIVLKNNILSEKILMNDNINENNNNVFINNNNGKNKFQLNNNSIFKQNSGEINDQKLIGKKRNQEKSDNFNNVNNKKNQKIEQEKKVLFNDILFICQEISNLNNDIIKKEEQNGLKTDSNNEKIETTLIINNNPIATIYLNGDVVNKIYVFKNQKNIIKENEILSQLKQIKKSVNVILSKLRKNNN